MEIVDNINHPKHYEDAGYLVQPIDVTQELPFCLGNAVKYIARAGKKKGSPETEDLEKALWYMQRQLDLWAPYQDDARLELSAYGSAAITVLSENYKCGSAFAMFEFDEVTHLAVCDYETLSIAGGRLSKRIEEMKAGDNNNEANK